MEISEIFLISLYVCKGNVKGNQANLRNLKKLENFENQNLYFPQNLDFFTDFKKYIFLKRKLSPLELRKPGLLFFMRISSVILRNVNFEKKVSPRPIHK